MRRTHEKMDATEFNDDDTFKGGINLVMGKGGWRRADGRNRSGRGGHGGGGWGGGRGWAPSRWGRDGLLIGL